METECITVTVERITFSNKETGYHVIRASCRGHRDKVTVVGNFSIVNPGEEMRLYGTWVCHPQFGMQFQVLKYTTLKPATLKGIEKYLGSGLIKGIGPIMAKRLVEAFGMETLEVIETDPERLATCPGIGQGRSAMITQGWSQQKAVQDVMIFLQGHGISTAYAVRIFKKLGSDSVKKVTENPYFLAYEIHGIGFKTADKIAEQFGITGADPRRLEAGVLFVINTALQDGHLFCRKDELLKKAQELLMVEETDMIWLAVNAQVENRRLILKNWRDEELVYNPFAFRDEHVSADIVGYFAANEQTLARDRVLAALKMGVSAQGLELAGQQALAVELSMKKSILVITGGPGTGKTTTLRALVSAHLSLNRTVLLASPTGRAAKRLAEVTGREALTVHRLLEYSPQENKFKRDRENPLPCDILVVDEASMLDMSLFHSILNALPRRAVLILVGDADQLPSVGPGLVLRHLIESEIVPVVSLTSIFRQAAASKIISNAHRVNSGHLPLLIEPGTELETDCFFVEADENERVLTLLKKIVGSSLVKKFSYDPLDDIQVLTPMNQGSLGANNLNRVLQETLNPQAPDKNEITHAARTFREGDKVIQLRNNYDLEVFNGDVGRIKIISSEDSELVIAFPQGEIVFQTTDLLDLGLAYAITVHKSQGSEYPAVIMLCATQHYMMLQRNLLYTGITRARKTMVLLGTKKAIGMAVRNNRVVRRNSIFVDLLREKISR